MGVLRLRLHAAVGREARPERPIIFGQASGKPGASGLNLGRPSATGYPRPERGGGEGDLRTRTYRRIMIRRFVP